MPNFCCLLLISIEVMFFFLILQNEFIDYFVLAKNGKLWNLYGGPSHVSFDIINAFLRCQLSKVYLSSCFFIQLYCSYGELAAGF